MKLVDGIQYYFKEQLKNFYRNYKSNVEVNSKVLD